MEKNSLKEYGKKYHDYASLVLQETGIILDDTTRSILDIMILLSNKGFVVPATLTPLLDEHLKYNSTNTNTWGGPAHFPVLMPNSPFIKSPQHECYPLFSQAIGQFYDSETIKITIIERLFENGLDPNLVGRENEDNFIQTALQGYLTGKLINTECGKQIHYFKTGYSEFFIHELIRRAKQTGRFNVNHKNKLGYTIVHSAIASETYTGSIISLLDTLGPEFDITVQDKEGNDIYTFMQKCIETCKNKKKKDLLNKELNILYFYLIAKTNPDIKKPQFVDLAAETKKLISENQRLIIFTRAKKEAIKDPFCNPKLSKNTWKYGIETLTLDQLEKLHQEESEKKTRLITSLEPLQKELPQKVFAGIISFILTGTINNEYKTIIAPIISCEPTFRYCDTKKALEQFRDILKRKYPNAFNEMHSTKVVGPKTVLAKSKQ